MNSQVKRAFKYRFHPTDTQAAELSRTFGCARLVYNRALTLRTQAWRDQQRSMTYNDTSAALTAWRRDPDLAFLNERSSVPLQQTLRHLQAAFATFFDKRANYPRYKSKKTSRAAAEYTRSAFTYRDGTLTLAKMAEPLAIVWSRPLPAGAAPSTVTVSRDRAGRWHTSVLCLLAAGLAASACGADGRPQREPSRTGPSAAKQETSGRPLDSPPSDGEEDVKPGHAPRPGVAGRTGAAGRRR